MRTREVPVAACCADGLGITALGVRSDALSGRLLRGLS